MSNGTDNLVCDGTVNGNSGCAVIEWSRASYGEYFESQGGGIFATKWDENEIATCACEPIESTPDTVISHRFGCLGSFYRAAIPQDILAGTPNPSGWGTPAAKLVPTNCNPFSNFFMNMSIVFGESFHPIDTRRLLWLKFRFRHDFLR